MDHEKLTVSLVESLVVTAKAWNSIFQQARELSDKISAGLRVAPEQKKAMEAYFIQAAPKEAIEAFQAKLREAFEVARQAYEVLPGKMRTSQKVLGESGWHLDPNLPLSTVWKIAQELEAGFYAQPKFERGGNLQGNLSLAILP